MKRNVKMAVTGAGGFIGHHLVTYLKNLGSGSVALIGRSRISRQRMQMSLRF